MAKSKNIELLIDSNIDGSKIYLGDYDKLWKIISNFTTNAIKFTEHGYVKVKLEQLKELQDIT